MNTEEAKENNRQEYYHYYERILKEIVDFAKKLWDVAGKKKEFITTAQQVQGKLKRISLPIKRHQSLKSRSVLMHIREFIDILDLVLDKRLPVKKKLDIALSRLEDAITKRHDCITMLISSVFLSYILRQVKKDELKEILFKRTDTFKVIRGKFFEINEMAQDHVRRSINAYRNCWNILPKILKDVLIVCSEKVLSDLFVDVIFESFLYLQDFLEILVRDKGVGSQALNGIGKLSSDIRYAKSLICIKNPKSNHEELADIFLELCKEYEELPRQLFPSAIIFVECKFQLISPEYAEVEKSMTQLNNLMRKVLQMIKHYYRLICGKKLPRIYIFLISNKKINDELISKINELLQDTLSQWVKINKRELGVYLIPLGGLILKRAIIN